MIYCVNVVGRSEHAVSACSTNMPLEPPCFARRAAAACLPTSGPLQSAAVKLFRVSMSAELARNWRPATLQAAGVLARAPAVQPLPPSAACIRAAAYQQHHNRAVAAAARQQWLRRAPACRRRSAASSRRGASLAAKTQAAPEAETDWASFEEEHLGPAAKATLNLLEWGRLCSQVGGCTCLL